MFRRKFLRILAFISLVLLVLIIISVTPQLTIPKPTGAYPVGRTYYTWADTSRSEELAENPGDSRNVPVIVWYPAEGNPNSSEAYFPHLDRLASDLVASGEVSQFEILGLNFIRAFETLDAPVAGQGIVYPVIILSPGNGTNVEFYAGIADELASYGYIVVGINHPYDVAAVALSDGRIARFAPGPEDLQARSAWVTKRISVRTADVLFVLQQLSTLNQSDPLLGHRLDLAHMAVMGHSLGGIAAAQACLNEPRLLSCLNLDGIQRGGPFSTDADPVTPQQPFMLITKETQLPQAFTALIEQVASDSYLVVIQRASHDSFTDVRLLIPSLIPFNRAADHILSLERSYTLAFFNQTLKNQPEKLLEKTIKGQDVSLQIFPAQ